jgi:hypothetical protein
MPGKHGKYISIGQNCEGRIIVVINFELRVNSVELFSARVQVKRSYFNRTILFTPASNNKVFIVINCTRIGKPAPGTVVRKRMDWFRI